MFHRVVNTPQVVFLLIFCCRFSKQMFQLMFKLVTLVILRHKSQQQQLI